MTTNIDANKINKLLGQKEQADKDVRDLLERLSIYKQDINGVLDSDYADARIVAVVEKASDLKLVRERVKKQKEANEALVEAAPMYFSITSQAFRTPIVLHDIVRLKVSVNEAVGSTKKTAQDFIRRYDRLIRRETAVLAKEQDEFKRVQIETMLQRYHAEKAQFEKSPDKTYRLRTFNHSDVVALFLRWGGSEVEKERIHAGGMFVVKHSMAQHDKFTVADSNKVSTSIYDELTPIENSLGLKGFIYDESEAELLRNSKKRNKSDNVEKIRPQGDDKTI